MTNIEGKEKREMASIEISSNNKLGTSNSDAGNAINNAIDSASLHPVMGHGLTEKGETWHC